MGEIKVWRKCGSCKKDILLGAHYQVCSVSSCHKYIFCSVDCWDLHVPVMNHKSAWAEERVAPTTIQNEEVRPPVTGKKILITGQSHEQEEVSQDDILIVASKLKAYVKAKHGLNTSADVMEKLSKLVRKLVDQAAKRPVNEGRKTLMDRDFLDNI